jgi:hypothetical protein
VLIVSILAAALLVGVAAWSFVGRPRERVEPGEASARSEPVNVTLYRKESVESDNHWFAGRPTERMFGALGMRGAGGTRVWPGLLGVAALIFVAGGPVALAVALVACLAVPAARLPRLALGAMVVSGLLCAVRPFGEGLFGPFGWPAQLCALVALAAALIPVEEDR